MFFVLMNDLEKQDQEKANLRGTIQNRKIQLYSSDSREKRFMEEVMCLTWPSALAADSSVFKKQERRPFPRRCGRCGRCGCWNTLVHPPRHTTPHCVCWTASWDCKRQMHANTYRPGLFFLFFQMAFYWPVISSCVMFAFNILCTSVVQSFG